MYKKAKSTVFLLYVILHCFILTKDINAASLKLEPIRYSSTINGIKSFFYFVFMFCVILGIAYFTTKFVAKKSIYSKQSKFIKLVEHFNLGFDKSIILIKVGEEYFLLANSQKSLSLISRIDKDKLDIKNEQLDKNEAIIMVEDYMENFDENYESQFGSEALKKHLKKLKSIVRGNRPNE